MRVEILTHRYAIPSFTYTICSQAGQSVARYRVLNDDEVKVQHRNCGERNVGDASNDDVMTSNESGLGHGDRGIKHNG